MTTIITANVGRHGTHEATGAAVELTITRYLPDSVANLRRLVEERSGVDFSDVDDIAAFLVILADFDWNTDESALSVDRARIAQRGA